MDEVQNKILLQAQKLFYQYGIRNVSMDDVANQSGVSKKTIYVCFDDKSALVIALVKKFVAENKLILLACNKQSSNAVEEVLMQVERALKKLAGINYKFFYEVEKYFPSAWQLLADYREKIVLPLVIANLKRGIEEGLFRNDLALQFTADIYMHHIDAALNPVNFTKRKFSVYDIMRYFTVFYLHGITTKKGSALINH